MAAMLAASSAATLLGALVFATRFVVHEVHPIPLAFLRYFIAFLCLAPLVLLQGRPVITRGDLKAVIFLGMLFFGVTPALLTGGLMFVPASRGALVLGSQVLLTLLVSVWSGYEPLTRRKVLGVALSLAGLATALGIAPVETGEGSGLWWGYLLLLGSAACASVYHARSRPYLRRVPVLAFNALGMLAGSLTLFLPALGMGLLPQLAALSAPGWWALLFTGTGGGALAFYLWAWALARTTPARVVVFFPLNPLTATLLGGLVLDEPLTPFFLVGMGCASAGILLATLPERS